MVHGNNEMPEGEEEEEEEEDGSFIFPGEEEPRDEVIDKVLGEAGAPRHPPGVSRPVVGRGGQVSRDIREIVDNTALLQAILSRTSDIQNLLIDLAGRIDLSYHDDYVSVDKTIEEGRTQEIDTATRLGRRGRRGYFKKDTADGTVNVQINEGKKIPVESTEVLDLDFLEITTIRITTQSSTPINFRLVQW